MRTLLFLHHNKKEHRSTFRIYERFLCVVVCEALVAYRRSALLLFLVLHFRVFTIIHIQIFIFPRLLLPTLSVGRRESDSCATHSLRTPPSRTARVLPSLLLEPPPTTAPLNHILVRM